MVGSIFKVVNGTRLFLEELPTENVVTEACNEAPGGLSGVTGFTSTFLLIVLSKLICT